jgi:glutamyl-tRNA reductase
LKLNLALIGVSYRTCPVDLRERFWLGEEDRAEALRRLLDSPGVEGAVVLATCNRTEFVLRTSDSRRAALAVLRFLRRRFGLRAAEWKKFYRLADEAAVEHLFSVASSLDSMVVGEPQITGQVKSAWAEAKAARATGRQLDALFQKALSVAKRVRNETEIGCSAVSVPYAAVQLARQIFGSLRGRAVAVLGAGRMAEVAARYLLKSGASPLWVMNRTPENARALAAKLGGTAVPFEERNVYLARADIAISSTGAPEAILGRADAERIRRARQGRPLFLIDIAVPRDIHPSVRELPGVFLYDIDDLEQVVERNSELRRAATAAAARIVAREAREFSARLEAERMVPTIVAFERRIAELCRLELERFRAERGPLAPAEERALEALTARLAVRLASTLARELKEVRERPDQDQLAAAIHRLFQLGRLETAAARMEGE